MFGLNTLRKIFITGEIDVFDKVSNSVLDFASLSAKGVAHRFEDIQTELYLSGISEKMPKITMEQILKVDSYASTVNYQSPVTHNTSNAKNSQYDTTQNTTVNRRNNAPKKERVKRHKMLSRRYAKNETLGYLKHLKPNSLQYIMGQDEFGNLIIQDLAREPHLMIAGKTGGGKTVTTFNILVSFAFANTPETLRLSLIDLKLLTFGDARIANSEFLHGVPPALDEESALELLRESHADMMERYKIMMEKNVKDYKDAGLHAHVIVIDEVAELLDMSEKALSKEVLKLISSIASMGRQGGVFLVMATQSPSAELLSGKLKTNLNTIGHLVSNSDQARILGLTDKENNPNLVKANQLNGNGDGLKVLNGHSTPTRFQATYIELKDHSSYQFF